MVNNNRNKSSEIQNQPQCQYQSNSHHMVNNNRNKSSEIQHQYQYNQYQYQYQLVANWTHA
jgi:hypothetical protein